MTRHAVDLHATNGADRVREHTAAGVLADLDLELADRITRHVEQAGSPGARQALDSRIAELEQEPDIESTLEKNASVIAFTGTVLAALHHRRWLIVPAVVTGFLFQHAVQGWCPPLALFRRLGIRTRQEIDAERFALKLIRGDCDLPPLTDHHSAERARLVLAAVAR